MRRAVHQDVFIGIVMVIISVLLYAKSSTMPEGAAQFPTIILTLFSIFGLVITIGGVGKTRAANSKQAEEPKIADSREEVLSFSKIKMPFVSILIVAAYVILLSVLGFFVATSIFIIGFMMFYRVRSWKKIFLTVFCIDLFVYLLFIIQLNVPLPKGLLF